MLKMRDRGRRFNGAPPRLCATGRTGVVVDITFFGHRCFRLRAKEVAVVTDPFPTPPGQALKVQAEVVTLCSTVPGELDASQVGGQPRVLSGPGEYEIKGVLITGVATFRDNAGGKERGKNTVYVLQMEEQRLCHLGELGHVLTTEQIDQIGTVDVLFVPADGKVLDLARTAEVISQIEPSIVVPMRFTSTDEAGLAEIEKFCHEMGMRQIVPQPRFSVTRGTLPQETQVVVLEVRQ